MNSHTSTFPRCKAKRSDGARCWLAPEHTGAHLCVKPGETPSASTIAKVAAARSDVEYRSLCMKVALEPIGMDTPDGNQRAFDMLRKVMGR